jgi:SAM-dependent methyltransferase
MPYLFDHETKAERERLAAIERAADPFTIECLEKIGVREGWHCLEIGAGAGSIAEWLCQRVGPNGKVVATDLQTKFLETIDRPNLEIRRHDVAANELESAAFDLVSARKVLEHLPNPTAALRRMAAAVRPGGWLLVEDSDLASFVHVSFPQIERFKRAYAQFLDALRSAGFQPTLGVRLGDELRAAGLREVILQGITGEWTAAGDHPVGKVYRMTIERLRERMVKAGLLSNTEVDQLLADIQSPDFHAMTGIHCAAWGRKPGESDGSPDRGPGQAI